MEDTGKIKKTLTITIVDENGSKQFTMAKVMQKIVMYGSVMLCMVIALGYFAMSSFIEQLDEINTAKQESYQAFQDMYQQNAFLQDDIQSKTEELQAMRDRVADLEKMVNFNSFHNDKTQISHIDLQALPDTQKATILQIIPNGNPLAMFEMKQKTTRNARDRGLIDMQYAAIQTHSTNTGYDYYTSKSEPVYATADGLVESTRGGNQKYGYGNIVRLSHVLGFSSAYTNLDRIAVKVGDFVSRGDIIGYTTSSPGKNHISLYYEVRFLSQGLDTLSFIDWDTQNFQSIFNVERNANIDVSSLMWALNDIAKLNDMSSHFAFGDKANLQQEEMGNIKEVLDFKKTHHFDNVQDFLTTQGYDVVSRKYAQAKQGDM
ncbi:M23 family metallopeptidase [Helicobacter trogontum]|uniref:M23 family metallopeptidase n=1 Tax=Helicobacter trogontum TaxID=50960 RepID=UPI000CF0D506|nr:M23 family metallopeptidase [Helicobacter trogontum]